MITKHSTSSHKNITLKNIVIDRTLHTLGSVFVCAEHEPNERLENVPLRQGFLSSFFSSTPKAWIYIRKALFCVSLGVYGSISVSLLLYYIILYYKLLLLLILLLNFISFNYFIDFRMSIFCNSIFDQSIIKDRFKSLTKDKRGVYNVKM